MAANHDIYMSIYIQLDWVFTLAGKRVDLKGKRLGYSTPACSPHLHARNKLGRLCGGSIKIHSNSRMIGLDSHCNMLTSHCEYGVRCFPNPVLQKLEQIAARMFLAVSPKSRKCHCMKSRSTPKPTQCSTNENQIVTVAPSVSLSKSCPDPKSFPTAGLQRTGLAP
jgi:hypothetical protein